MVSNQSSFTSTPSSLHHVSSVESRLAPDGTQRRSIDLKHPLVNMDNFAHVLDAHTPERIHFHCLRTSFEKSRTLENRSNTLNSSIDDPTSTCMSFFADASAKQRKIKKMFKWLQKNGQKVTKTCKYLKNSTIPCKKGLTTKLQQTQTLHEVLRSKESTKAFRQFLVKEMSEENLDFWLEVEFFKKQKAEKQQALAGLIFQTYIAPDAPNEINIDCQIRKQTRTNLQSPGPSSFDLAQSQVFKLMDTDSFRRFLKSRSC